MVNAFLRVFMKILLAEDIIVMMLNFALAPGEMYGLYKYLYVFVKTAFLPLVCVNYLIATPIIDKHIILFVILQWIGDVILLKQGIFYTALGGHFFGFGHISMILFFNVSFKKVPWYAYLLALPPFVFMYGLIFPHMRWDHVSQYGCLLYCTVLLISSACAVFRLCKYSFKENTFILCWFGYILFIFSDYFLIVRDFEISKKMRRIETMLTYCIAQIMIVIGTSYAQKDLKIKEKVE